MPRVVLLVLVLVLLLVVGMGMEKCPRTKARTERRGVPLGLERWPGRWREREREREAGAVVVVVVGGDGSRVRRTRVGAIGGPGYM
jgi:hypothetical protein